MPDVPWPRPLPLEGVKSRKRPIFEVPKASFKSNDTHSMNTFTDLELTLESRVAVAGDRLCRSTIDLLLGTRKLVTGELSRQYGLLVCHLGPHLMKNLEQDSVELYLQVAAAALEQRPHVLILDEAQLTGSEVWSQAFHQLLHHQSLHEFRGAVVICAAEETQGIRRICQQRWTGAGEWLWQESMEEDECLEFSEDVLSKAGEESYVEEQFVQEIRSQNPFLEDTVKVAQDGGWTLTVLTTLESDHAEVDEASALTNSTKCKRRLAGFICYTFASPGYCKIKRIAVVKLLRKGGYGRRLLRFALDKASQRPHSEVAWVALSAMDAAVPWYERFGFIDMTADDLEASEHRETEMELPNISTVCEFLSEAAEDSGLTA